VRRFGREQVMALWDELIDDLRATRARAATAAGASEAAAPGRLEEQGGKVGSARGS
jgi:hypothetical protein